LSLYIFCSILIACNAGHYEIVELLLKHNANVNTQSTSGNTALHYSAGGVRNK
jgi:ankyrin repeat protein